jgi:hypothetical protein
MAKTTGKSVAALTKEVNALKRQVADMRRETPIDPAQAASMAVAREARPGERADFIRVAPGNANYSEPVNRDLARMGGRSRSDLASDQSRGAGSPIGHGEIAEREARRKRK